MASSIAGRSPVLLQDIGATDRLEEFFRNDPRRQERPHVAGRPQQPCGTTHPGSAECMP
jgi:hypothetical protein